MLLACVTSQSETAGFVGGLQLWSRYMQQTRGTRQMDVLTHMFGAPFLARTPQAIAPGVLPQNFQLSAPPQLVCEQSTPATLSFFLLVSISLSHN
jgi:hypothetical protein